MFFMETDKLTLSVTRKSNSPRITLFILKRKNVKALPEKNIYYETIVMVENLVVALLKTTGIFFTCCCGCCSYCWFLHTFSVGLLLGKESCFNRECLGGPTPAQHGPEQWLFRGTKALFPCLRTDSAVQLMSPFLEGEGWG